MMFPFWLQAHWHRLCWALGSSRPAHALLFQSRAGLGAEQLALAYAHRLLCLNAKGDQHACGDCAGCSLTNAGHHPDLMLVKIADEKKGLSIEQIRDLSQRLQHSAHRGGFRVAVLYDADTMSIGAANALLKTLEEPGADSVLMLLSNFPDRLSATIRSRCSRVTVNAPAEADAIAWLVEASQQSQAVAIAALQSAGGAPLLALDRLQGGDSRELALRELIGALLTRNCDPIQVAAECEDAEFLFDALLRRCALGMQQSSAMVWGELSELTLDARRQLRAANNLTTQNVIEQLLLRWFDLARKLDHSKLA